jgi:NodT family efflux transporter outer membrane factor (OMF) lipoprotein
MSTRSIVLGVALAASLAGCVERGDWKPAAQLQPQGLGAQQTLAGAKLDAAAWPSDQWWRGYGDPQLDALIAEALAGSPSLEIAEARLRAARAQAIAAGAARVPAATLDAETTRQRYPEHGLFPPPFAGSYSTDARVALDFSFDLDFWGRNRALLAAAGSGVQAADADRAAARLALAVGVVRAYIQLDLWYALLDVANDNLKQQTAILELTQQRVSAGLENTARVKQSEGSVALTRAGVASVQASIELARNQLADLVAAGPDRGLRLQPPRLAAPADLALPSALPADLLARRPDVAAARAQVEAAAHGVAAAEADFYPNVNLTAFAGLQSIGLSQLFQGSDRIVGAGPALHLPVFNRGGLRSTLQSQQAQLDQSVGEYNRRRDRQLAGARAREPRAADRARGRAALLRADHRALSRRAGQLPERAVEPEPGVAGTGAARAVAGAAPVLQRRPGAGARRRLLRALITDLKRLASHLPANP